MTDFSKDKNDKVKETLLILSLTDNKENVLRTAFDYVYATGKQQGNEEAIQFMLSNKKKNAKRKK